MSKLVMGTATTFCFISAAVTSILFFYFNRDIYQTLAITFGTTAYHLGIRLLVGFLYNIIMKNQADYTKKWFQVRSWEYSLYQYLKVKSWKNKMPTYNPEFFSAKNHTLHEIAQAMCQSELVHETNMILSFLPLIAVKWFGSFYVFFITSICGAIFDLVFVIIQRYNRARIVKLLGRPRCGTDFLNRRAGRGDSHCL